MPDIDHPQSAFGKRVLPLSIPIAAVFGHRGITHSLLAVAGMSWLIWWSLHHLHWQQGYAVPVVVGVATGYLSHLVGDWLTNSVYHFCGQARGGLFRRSSYAQVICASICWRS